VTSRQIIRDSALMLWGDPVRTPALRPTLGRHRKIDAMRTLWRLPARRH
jgi:hypothetical protein